MGRWELLSDATGLGELGSEVAEWSSATSEQLVQFSQWLNECGLQLRCDESKCERSTEGTCRSQRESQYGIERVTRVVAWLNE